ncbi:MAG: hypothetical protein J6W64_01825 [Bacilli bacterium]|nr:hypothetical protein [Bacilli bacterium]
MDKIYNVKKINQMRCASGIIMGSIMSILALYALILNLSNYYNDDVPEAGIGTLRMFTTLSNLVLGAGAFLTIPFQIDGLRKKNYHLPRWIVDVLYFGTLGVALTFVFSVTFISLAQGFSVAMFSKSNVFLHTINPIIAIILFTFINSDHNIKFYKSLLSIIPIFLYSVVYLIFAIIIGEDAGGWRDVYGLNAFIPWTIIYTIFLGLTFGLSNLLRFLHNKKHAHTKKMISNYYLKSHDFDNDDINSAIIKIAKEANYSAIDDPDFFQKYV